MDTETHRKERLHQFLVNRRAILMGGAGAAAAALPSFSRTARAGPSTPMHFIGWQYNPQIVSENVDTFKKLYDENVEYELVSGEYHAIAETKLMAGQHIDMMYSEEDRIVRWKKAG
jgi:multiple sugar transport system substrate-binding protein